MLYLSSDVVSYANVRRRYRWNVKERIERLKGEMGDISDQIGQYPKGVQEVLPRTCTDLGTYPGFYRRDSLNGMKI
jgi:hypothetical protein